VRFGAPLQRVANETREDFSARARAAVMVLGGVQEKPDA
jgi:hypothetical protein